MPSLSADCIVIGAGVAGLACTRRLREAGISVILLEGRSRIGGRVFTHRDSLSSAPMELGAEFIHGAPPSILDRADLLGLTYYDVSDRHERLGPDGLKPSPHFWDQIQEVIDKLDPKREIDRSIEEFLRAHHSIEPQTRALVKSFIEGFHAANLELIGERGLAASEQASDDSGADLNGVDAFRFVDGYDRLAAGFLHGLASKDFSLRLGVTAKSVTWKKGHVRVDARSTTSRDLAPFNSKAVVVTVPIGVLQARPASPAAIAFHPTPAGLTRALTGLHSGHAMRITFRFRTRFWDEGREHPMGYIHAGPEHDFPTWWSQMPLRTPQLVAWQGGPKAEQFARLSETERVSAALNTLAKMLELEEDFIHDQLESWAMHDWTNDPFSLGAYSYIGVEGDHLARELAHPFENTLFFAGEATHIGHERGTVDGAIETGLRAAKQVIETLAK